MSLAFPLISGPTSHRALEPEQFTPLSFFFPFEVTKYLYLDCLFSIPRKFLMHSWAISEIKHILCEGIEQELGTKKKITRNWELNIMPFPQSWLLDLKHVLVMVHSDKDASFLSQIPNGTLIDFRDQVCSAKFFSHVCQIW